MPWLPPGSPMSIGWPKPSFFMNSNRVAVSTELATWTVPVL